MIELSFTKLLLVAVIALLVLGPEKLPKAARMAGAMLRRARLGWDSVRSEVERELELEEIRRTAKAAADQAESLQRAADDAAHAASASAGELRADVLKLPDADATAASDPATHGEASAGGLPAPAPDGAPDPVTSLSLPATEGTRDGEA
jgi:sec-independent protein translocase protein TatB